MRCSLGTIAAGAKVTITIVAKHKQARCAQRNAASGTAAGTDATPADNLDTVRICAAKIRLRLTKVADRSAVAAGGLVSYTIVVANPSEGTARNVRICDHLPAGLVALKASPRVTVSEGRYCWMAKRLGAGESKRYELTVRALPGAAGRTVNTATASSRGVRSTARAARAVRVLPRQAAGGGVTG
jgi:uncharacterized repeat protein (TIGR01451 family)